MGTNKHEKILSVASKLIAKKGYAGTSLQEIANKVYLHKSSLFHYFKNKEELLLTILEKTVEEVDTNLEKIILNKRLSIEEKFKEAIDNHLILLTQHLDVVNIYLNETRNLSKKYRAVYLEKRKKYGKNFETIVMEMKAKGYFRGLDTEVVTFGILGMLNWVVKWYKTTGPLSIKEIADIFCRMLMK